MAEFVPLRVAVNLTWLRPGEVGGTETYARRWLRSIASNTPHELLLFGTQRAIEAVLPADGHNVIGVEFEPGPTIGTRIVAERIRLTSVVRGHDVDVVHHLGGTVPFVLDNAPTSITIHDLQPLDQPGNFGPMKRRWLRRAIPESVSRADAICTPSTWVADSIRHHFSTDADAVPVWADPIDSTARSSRAPTPYVLYPAMTTAHKNHAVLFAAFARARRNRPDLTLICVGTTGDLDDEIRRRASRIGGIEMRGHVTSTVYADLLAGAEQVVFPSRYEGFGLPVLEAQASGVLVAVADATALPEVAGPEARLIDPDDVAGWATALVEPPDGTEAAHERARGRANAARYSAITTAARQQLAWSRILDGSRASTA